MSAFVIIVILGFLLIIGGISMAGSPMITFSNAGILILVLFLISGGIGIVQGIKEKRYDKEFFFAILSLVLGIGGFVIPEVRNLNNNTLLYLAAAWLFIRGLLSIIFAVNARNKGGSFLEMIIGILLGTAELGLCVYSAANPSSLAANIGTLIGLFYVIYGSNIIFLGSSVCKGGNNLSIIFTVIGVLVIIGGISLMFIPMSTFFNIGYAIVLLFFINGILGIFRAVNDKTYDLHFVFAILSTILGIVGYSYPGMAELDTNVILYIAAIWLFVSAILDIIRAVRSKKDGASTFKVIIGVAFGVMDLMECISYVAYPRTLAFDLGLLVGICFITSGFKMIMLASDRTKKVAESRAQSSESPSEA